jgi:hypothetical protein
MFLVAQSQGVSFRHDGRDIDGHVEQCPEGLWGSPWANVFSPKVGFKIERLFL